MVQMASTSERLNVSSICPWLIYLPSDEDLTGRKRSDLDDDWRRNDFRRGCRGQIGHHLDRHRTVSALAVGVDGNQAKTVSASCTAYIK